MKLLLMRHGEAEANASTDAERELTRTGKSDNQSIARAMAERGLQPEIIIASPYRRAQQTAQIVQRELTKSATNSPAIETSDLFTPDENVMTAIRYLATRQEQTILVVTHNPLVSGLINMICSDAGVVRMGTSSVVEIDAEFVDIGSGELQWQRHC